MHPDTALPSQSPRASRTPGLSPSPDTAVPCGPSGDGINRRTELSSAETPCSACRSRPVRMGAGCSRICSRNPSHRLRDLDPSGPIPLRRPDGCFGPVCPVSNQMTPVRSPAYLQHHRDLPLSLPRCSSLPNSLWLLHPRLFAIGMPPACLAVTTTLTEPHSRTSCQLVSFEAPLAGLPSTFNDTEGLSSKAKSAGGE